ncbi:MAG: DNA-directed RNA polymerase subunit omega [Myxococcota bacterium]
MARVTVEDCLNYVPNRFALVLLATGRTRQLLKGSRPLVPHAKNKEAVLSLREIASGRVHFDRDVNEVLAAKLSDLRTQTTVGQSNF